MKKLYSSLMWLTMILFILDLLCACFNWVIVSIVVTILLLVSVIGLAVVYMVFVKHKCEKCNTIFKGKRLEIFFAPHTPTKRKMFCLVCGEKMWCEDYFGSLKDKEKDDVK